MNSNFRIKLVHVSTSPATKKPGTLEMPGITRPIQFISFNTNEIVLKYKDQNFFLTDIFQKIKIKKIRDLSNKNLNNMQRIVFSPSVRNYQNDNFAMLRHSLQCYNSHIKDGKQVKLRGSRKSALVKIYLSS